MAPPLEITIEASNGASDYGNKFGEPVLAGFARSFGMMLPNGERREWVKPIMFSGGIGMIDGEGVTKLQPEKGKNIFPKISKERKEKKRNSTLCKEVPFCPLENSAVCFVHRQNCLMRL